MAQEPIRIALIGTGKRMEYLYEPILRAMPEVKLVGLWSRSEESAQRMGKQLNLPWYTDLNRLMADHAPQIGIVSVAYSANGVAGLMAVEHGLNVLLETPIAHKLSEADAIINAANARGLKIEIAEQFHRRPLEALKLKLLETGAVDAQFALDLEGVVLESFGLLPTEQLTGGDTTIHMDLASQGTSALDLVGALNGEAHLMVENAVLQNGLIDMVGSDVLVESMNKLNPFRKEDPTTNLECALVDFKIDQYRQP